jgi:molybdopterin converting factor subunit 1
MRVRILYFGVLKDIAGREREELDIPADSSVDTVLSLLKERIASKAEVWGSIAVAVNQEYVRSTALLQDGDEVALLPPVSGGI